MSNTLKRGSGEKLVSRKAKWTVGGLDSGQIKNYLNVILFRLPLEQ